MKHITRLTKMILTKIIDISMQVIFLRLMNKMKIATRFFYLLVGIILGVTADAQIAESVTYRKIENPILNRFVDCTNQDAGIHFFGSANIFHESSDLSPNNLSTVPPPTMLTFCFGDSLELRHLGGNLSGDPDISTPAGFGYAIYTCPPTVTGGTLQDIQGDPCVLRNTDGEIQIYTQGRIDGNVDFFNQGFFQNFPPNTGDPIQMWFAPITFDYLDATSNVAGFEIDTDNQPDPGPCVEVNVADTFSVLYLNPIQIEILDNVLCGGQLRITGGMPEYYDRARSGPLRLERYTINIRNEADQSIMGMKCSGGRPEHDEEFFFVVPEPGRYRIIVSDAKGCNVADEFMDISCAPIEVNLGQNANVMNGDVHCVEVTVTNFIDLSGFQWQIQYDPTVLELIESSIVRNSIFPTNALPFVLINDGLISFQLFDPSLNIYTLNDNDILATFCFNVIGNEGDCSIIDIFDGPSNDIRNERYFCDAPALFNPSQVCLRSTSIDIATCSGPAGTTDGSIIFGPTVGTPGFTYTIEDSANPGTVIGSGMFPTLPDTIEHTGFGPGTYTITITDANGMIEIGEAVIADAPRLNIDALTPTQPSCVGDTDGAIDLVTSGGVGTITNSWTGPNGFSAQNTDPITGLEIGMYNVLVTDENGCPAMSMRNLFVDSIRVTMSAEQLTSCPGGTDGRVLAQATGGAAPYDFIWNGGPPAMDFISHTVTNAPSGQQILQVIDENGCSITVDTFFLGSLNVLDVDSSFTDLTCFDRMDGAISIIPRSGVGPYTYNWNDIGLGDMDRSGLNSGSYSVVVMDSEGCFDSLQFLLSTPDSLNVFVDSTLSTPFVCFGDMNGRVILQAVGGDLTSAPPIVQWTNNVSDDFGALNLPGGTYDITVTDARGCTDLTTYTITEASEINYTIPPLQIPNCPGDSTALTVIDGSGGAGGPYLFNVNGGRDYFVDSTILAVPAGRYTIEVTDTIGCSDISIVTVEDPDGMTITLPDEVIVNLGDSTQLLTPDIRPIARRDSIVSYQWSPPIDLTCDTCAITGVYPTNSDTYTLTITDVKGCTYSEDVLVRSRKIRNVFIPNAFTPNGDGNNPVFNPITGQGVAQITSFRVFNRWGDVLYEDFNIPPGANGELSGWDGTDGDNREMPIGVYIYAVEALFIDGIEITYKGDVTLLR